MAIIVCIRRFSLLQEAQIAKEFLISNDIKADVFSDNAGGAERGMEFGLGNQLMINDEDSEKALELLNSLD